MIPGLAGGLLWALDTVILSLVLAPFSLQAAAPLAATACHDLLSALWLSLYTTVRGQWKPVLQALKSRDGHRVMLAALLGGPVGMAGYVMAIRWLGPGLSAAISSCYPALGLAAGALFLHERVSRSQILGITLSLVCLVVMSGARADSTQFVPGLIAALLCTAGWAAEGLLVQKAAGLSQETALLLRQWVSGSVFWLLVLPLFHAWSLAGDILVSGWLLPVASLAGTASYLCYYLAIHRLGAARAMPLNITYCAWAVLLDWLFTGIAPGWIPLVCCAGIIAGGILSAAGPRKKAGPGAGASLSGK